MAYEDSRYAEAIQVLSDLLADYIAECHRSYNLAKRPGRFYGEDMPLVKRARAAIKASQLPQQEGGARMPEGV